MTPDVSPTESSSLWPFTQDTQCLQELYVNCMDIGCHEVYSLNAQSEQNSPNNSPSDNEIHDSGYSDCSDNYETEESFDLLTTDSFVVETNTIAPCAPHQSIQLQCGDGLSDYTMEIIEYLMRLEVIQKRVLEDAVYQRMRNNKGIPVAAKSREIVIDWLIQVQNYLNFQLESLMLGIAIFDLYCQHECPELEVIQLIAITAILLATKYVEEDPPEIKYLIDLTENSYNKQQVLEMEKMLITFLSCKMEFAVPFHFRCFYIDQEPLVVFTTDFLLELVMKESIYLTCEPSRLTVSCNTVAQLIHGVTPWYKTTQFYPLTKYGLHDIIDAMGEIISKLNNASSDNRRGARDKYADPKYLSVSKHSSVLQPRIDGFM